MRKMLYGILFLCLQEVLAQEIVVLDLKTKEPLVNVAIFNVDKSKTVLSDFDGRSDLSIFDLDERITFKHISYEVYKTNKGKIVKQKGKIYLSPKLEQLDEVVISVSKWEQQKKDVPNKIESISASDIAFTNPQTAADLLLNSGKVFVQKSQLGGGSPMIRGFATNRLLLTVDGVRMNNAIFRGGNIQNVISLDPYAIKNTEIIFGPGSVIYGSDAIGGVMNFYTKKADFSIDESNTFSGVMNYRFASASSENTAHFDFNFGKKKWAFFTGVSYNNFGDLKMGAHGPNSYLRNNYVIRSNELDIVVENEDPKKQVTTGYSQINLMQKIAFRPNNKVQAHLGLHYSETSDYSRYDRLIRPNRTGTGLRYAEWYYGPQKWFMGNLQISKKGKGLFYDGLKITSAYQHFEESRIDRSFQELDRSRTEEKVDAVSLNIDFENKRVGDLRFYYGGEFIFNKVASKGRIENIETKTISNAASRYPDGSTWQALAAYTNVEYRAKPNLTMLSGLRYSHVWLNADFDKTFFPFPFDNAHFNNGALTASVGLSWFPKEDLQVTWNGSTGFRAPNIDDIGKVFDSEPGAVVVPNLDVKPEYAYNVEIGIKKKFSDKVVLKGAAFYTYLVDALVRRDFQFNGQSEIEYNGELSTVQAIQNASKAYVYGFELGLDVFIGENFSIISNFTFTKGFEEEISGVNLPSRHVAPSFGDAHLKWKNQKFNADLFLNYNGEIAFADLAPSEQKKDYIYASDADGNPFSPSWYTLNFRSQYAISNALKATFSVENITNQRYRSYSSGIVAPGTNLILGLEYKF